MGVVGIMITIWVGLASAMAKGLLLLAVLASVFTGSLAAECHGKVSRGADFMVLQ